MTATGVTVTSCVQLAELPEKSVAVQMTAVMPTGKFAGALLFSVGAISTISETAGISRLGCCPWTTLTSV